jgi:hypothetical protein
LAKNKCIKQYNTKIVLKKINQKKNDNPIQYNDAKKSKNYKYNFINVTNILHKLLETLATSRVTVALPT